MWWKKKGNYKCPYCIIWRSYKKCEYIDFPFVILGEGTKCHKGIATNLKYFYYYVKFTAAKIDNRDYNRHDDLWKSFLKDIFDE